MPMQKQPEGTSRVRLTPKVENPETGKPFPADRFGIDFADPDFGKQRIGETHRVLEGKRRGWWEPHSVVPARVLKNEILLLEPVCRHNDAIEYLRDVWILAKSKGWKSATAASPAAPVQTAGEVAERQQQNLAEQEHRDAVQAALGDPPEGQADRRLEPVSAPPEAAEPVAAWNYMPPSVPLEDLPEMEGIPVVPVPPETDLAQFVFPAAAKSDTATSFEREEVIREIPAGHPDDPSARDGSLAGMDPGLLYRPAGEPVLVPETDPALSPGILSGITEQRLQEQLYPGAPLARALEVSPEGLAEHAAQEFQVPVSRPGLPGPIPQADPAVQEAVVLADDWLNQPASPAPSFAPDDGDPFPLDFP